MAARGPSRRGVLLGTAGAAVVVVGGGLGLVEAGAFPHSAAIRRRLGWTGPAGQVPSVHPGTVVRGTTSGVEWGLVLPPGVPASGLPVVIALGGRGQPLDYLLHNLGLPAFLAAGHHRFGFLAVAGKNSYYHRRRDGSDVGALVVGPLLAKAARHGFDVSRPAFLGWSMGGYGSLLLATERVRASQPLAAVAVSSAALWPSYEASAPGAFDDAADFSAHDVADRTALLRRVPIRLDCGEQDPFLTVDKAFATRVGAQAHYADGGHNGAYWTRVLPAQLRWLDRRLA